MILAYLFLQRLHIFFGHKSCARCVEVSSKRGVELRLQGYLGNYKFKERIKFLRTLLIYHCPWTRDCTIIFIAFYWDLVHTVGFHSLLVRPLLVCLRARLIKHDVFAPTTSYQFPLKSLMHSVRKRVPYFDVIYDLQFNRRMETWNLFDSHYIEARFCQWWRHVCCVCPRW